jgi:hypothetical protein
MAKAKMSITIAKTLLLRLLVISIFMFVLVSVIAYARGYRFSLKTKSIVPTGILATSSNPKNTKVYVNGVLKGVTDQNFTMPPGEYTIEMKKEGYTDWSKKIILRGEIVMSLDGLLFPKNPSLSPLTSIGVIKAIPVDTNRLLLFSDNGDVEKDGIYIFEKNQRPLSLLPPLTPILLKSTLPTNIDFKTVTVQFSHDYSQAIFDFPTEDGSVSYLLSLHELNTQPFDITTSKEALLLAWTEERNREVFRILQTFPLGFSKIATDSFQLISFSPDEKKVLYEAKKTVTLPILIKPPLIGASQASETRSLEAGKLYIYDRKEDKNFEVKDVKLETPKDAKLSPTPRLPRPSPTIAATSSALTAEPLIDTRTVDNIAWYPDSRHFIIKEKGHITVVDYDDGGNKRTVYSGPFQEDFFNVTPEGKLLIITNLNPQYNKSSDLYEVGIR